MNENQAAKRTSIARLILWVILAALLVAATVVVARTDVIERVRAAFQTGRATDQDAHHHDEDPDSIELSPQAQANMKLDVQNVRLGPFEQTITVPGMVVEIPGRSRVRVASPLGGTVARVYITQGQAIEPGAKMFDVLLTHEELVEAQGELLRVAEQLDVVRSEVQRLKELSQDGGLGGRRYLEQSYEQEKLEADLRARAQGLTLHGLSSQQVDQILKTRTLLHGLTVYAPSINAPDGSGGSAPRQPLLVHKLLVEQGQAVSTGEALAILTDHAQLYIEGSAFEQDAPALARAQGNNWKVTAVFPAAGSRATRIEDLPILYIAGEVEEDTRALHFFLPLENEPAGEVSSESSSGVTSKRQYPVWRFRPGQRVQLKIPIERWEDQIVLPRNAVIKEGPDFFVIQPKGNGFRRTRVHVAYQDRDWAVIARDDSLYPGEKVVAEGAYLVHLAIKGKAGGGEGHDHHH